MESFVQELIAKKRKRYLEDYSEMLGDYNRELETIKGYNGRQLLELLQNCDDEGAATVTISLNQIAKTISINNDGLTSFSKKGYRSLFIANLSSKTSKRKYIGNKGLGFRSIINWSKAIEIQSNNLSLFYSERNRKASYENLFTSEQREKIAIEEDLAEEIVPLPFLSTPELKRIQQEDYKTSIIITYKEKAFKDILKQVNNITSETLLFLKNIREINFVGFDGIEDIRCEREILNKSSDQFSPKEIIKFSGNSWSIFEEERLLPKEFQDSEKKEEEFYQIKIAIDDMFESSAENLYSFFPTNIKLKQPYVLHATFDLDATRNQINDSEKNRFLLEKVVEFTIKVAKFYSIKEVSYQPLLILNHEHNADTLENLGYYDLIKNAIVKEAIFPCVDNTYRTLEEVIYINDEFAEFLIDANVSDTIGIHILPLKELSIDTFDFEDEIDDSLEVLKDYLEVINEVSMKPLSVEQRALWIRLLINEADFIKQKHPNSLNFLLNKNEKIIDGGEYIYTPITRDQELKTPRFANIQFVNGDLFDALLIELAYSESENPNKSRFIYDKLKGFCNIHSYEPATLAQKIISETNNAIIRSSEDTVGLIQEMNGCLYHNFKLMKEGTIIPDDSIKIPCLNKTGTKTFTEDLILSDYYPTGDITTKIFEGALSSENFVAEPFALGLPVNHDNYQVENYLLWIKVNRYARYQDKSAKKGMQNYVQYVEDNTGFGSYSSYEIKYKVINGFESILKQLSVEKLILWIYYDSILKQQLVNHANTDSFEYFYRYNYRLTNKPSFIKFIIEKNYHYKFSEFLLDEKYSWVNDFKVNYKEIINFDRNINRTIINEILVSLGARESFNQLPIERVAEIINKLPENYPTGDKSQTFYKRALNHYTENGIEIDEPLKLFASNGIKLQLFNQNQIYFSEKIKLPNRLKKDFPIFNYPARAGGADAIKFFGINDLNQIKINVLSKEELPYITAEFSLILDKIKPFLLSLRFNVIDDLESRKAQASICKKIKILLCSNIEYEVESNNYKVADYEFLHLEEQTYVIRVNEHETMSSLIKNVSFTNSFADIISLAFDVNSDKNDYKYILRSDYEDVLNSIKNDLGSDTLNDAREFLGLADYKQAFWHSVFLAKGLDYENFLDDLALEEKIKKCFKIDFDTNNLDYEKINSENELTKIQFLFADLKLSLSSFAEQYPYEISLAPLHLATIKDAILSKKVLIKSALWKRFLDKSVDDKKQFLETINKFENYWEFAHEKAEEFKHEFEINKNNIFKEFKSIIYGDLVLSERIKLEDIKSTNETKFTKDELFEINQYEGLKSLLYFQDCLDVLKEQLIANSIIDNEENDIEVLENRKAATITTRIINSDLLKPQKLYKNHSPRGVFTPKTKNFKVLKERGNNSEETVYNHLINNGYENVDWVSRDNEGLHYDLRYTNQDKIVKYIEVKTFDNGNFFLSKPEYDFGKANHKDYEIWLVKNKQDIIPIYDFFSNSKYKKIVNEYIVYLEII